ncbi:choice-of-anchor J domain-containing protein [Kaistella sp.]|uniref:choice-of-anchor J domain-containing protein n=1 Tax=Kaistella sp. TaxID=2782235 RepID=UPI003C36E76D
MTKKLLLASALGLGAFYYGQTIVFEDNFNDPAKVALWANTDRDGDGEKWEFYNAEEDEMPAFTGDFATSWSWFLEAFTPDNTLTSPAFALPNEEGSITLKFKVGAFDEEIFEEHYAVYVISANSTFTGTETPVFEETLDAGYTEVAKSISVDISEYAGQQVQLVFRHYDCTDIAFIGLDDVEVSFEEKMAVSAVNKNLISIYPNPTSDFIKIQNVKGLQSVRIFDMSGKKIKETSSADIDVRNLSAGQYILNIYSGNEVISRKFIKK